MKSNQEILKEYNKKLSSLKKNSDLYYNKDNPKISDDQFDQLKIELKNLEKKFPFLKKKIQLVQ